MQERKASHLQPAPYGGAQLRGREAHLGRGCCFSRAAKTASCGGGEKAGLPSSNQDCPEAPFPARPALHWVGSRFGSWAQGRGHRVPCQEAAWDGGQEVSERMQVLLSVLVLSPTGPPALAKAPNHIIQPWLPPPLQGVGHAAQKPGVPSSPLRPGEAHGMGRLQTVLCV